jgi:hypothetical protein
VHLRATVAPLLSALLLGGCGGGRAAKPEPTTATAIAPVKPAPARSPLALPADVPRNSSGPADAVATRTIRGWARALRAGDLARAGSFWALPAKIQNGTPVLTLSSRADVRIFNGSLTCGAVLTGAGAARAGYTIATFRLTERRGGHGLCGRGVGHRARTAVRLRGGQIVGWYRLPDAEPAPVI